MRLDHLLSSISQPEFADTLALWRHVEDDEHPAAFAKAWFNPKGLSMDEVAPVVSEKSENQASMARKLEWLQVVEDVESRTSALQAVLDTWFEKSPEEALAWIRTNEVPSEIEARYLEFVDADSDLD